MSVSTSNRLLKKGKSNSEKLGGAQYLKQMTLQKKAIRFKRSDDGLGLPGNFKVGEAIGGGDCFFDSVAQGLKCLKPEMDFTVESLRKTCKELATGNQELKDRVVRDARVLSDPTVIPPSPSITDDGLWNVYLASVEYTGQDIKRMKNEDNVLYRALTSLKYGSTLQVPVWGRTDIEGRMICQKYNVKLYVAEKINGVFYTQLIDSGGARSVGSIDYDEEDAIYLVNKGKQHFEPILNEQKIQREPQSSDLPNNNDGNDKIAPEEESLDIIDNSDLDEEKLKSNKAESSVKHSRGKVVPKGIKEAFVKQQSILQERTGDTAQIAGAPQDLVGGPARYQRILAHLDKVRKFSVYGAILLDGVDKMIRGDLEGVATNLAFIPLSLALDKAAEFASFKGLNLVSEQKVLLGLSLRVSSPFLARGTSAFIIYDLSNQIEAFKNGTGEAVVGIVGDSVYLGVDVAEVGIEVAEAFGAIEGVSSATGPIGGAVGAVVLVFTGGYVRVRYSMREVSEIDKIIHLTKKEKFIEGLRALIGMQPGEDTQELLEEKDVSNKLVRQKLGYLKQHSDIRSYVFPTGKSVVDSCRTVPYKTSICNSGGLGGGCFSSVTVTRYAQECTTKFQVDLTNTVLLGRKKSGIKWGRARPDDPIGGKLFCLPEGDDEHAPSSGSYECKNAIGVTDLSDKTGNYALIDLGEGKDHAEGFIGSPNIFVVNNGYKGYTGGDRDDLFILHGDFIGGFLHGKGGVDTLDLVGFALNVTSVDVRLDAGRGSITYEHGLNEEEKRKIPIMIVEIERILGRKGKQEVIHTVCNTEFIDGRGGAEDSPDIIVIDDIHCTQKMEVIVNPNTNINNKARNGKFDYVLLPGKGKAEVNIVRSPDGVVAVAHNFFFNSTIFDLMGVYVQNVNQTSSDTATSVTFSFLSNSGEPGSTSDSKSDEGRFNVTVSGTPVNASYVLGDGAKIKVGNKGNIYMFGKTNKSAEEIVGDYSHVKSRLSKMLFFIQTLLSNETVVMGSENHEVIPNDPLHKSHLVGGGGEDVYVINSESTRYELPLPEVVIYDFDQGGSVDTVDLRDLAREARSALSSKDSFKLQVLRSGDDLLLKATVEKPMYSSVNGASTSDYFTVRLKDGFHWYNSIHVIVENAPMRISLNNNEWSLEPQPLVFEKDKEVIVVTSQDVEEDTELITPRRAGNYTFARGHGSDLMITNAFDTQEDLCTITLSKFYETPKMKTLSIKFADKEIILKDKQGEINTARDIDVVKREHKEQVYSDVFNRTKRSTEPHKHRHQNPRRRSTNSSARASSWINDLFGWVKSSVGGLLSSKPELSRETSSTPSSISQVDAQIGVNGTIMLLDMLVRKFTNQRYISTVDQSMSPLQAQGYALSIIGKFEKVVEQAARDSKISIHRLDIDFVGMQEEVTGKIMSGKFDEISRVLKLYIEKACPGREAGCPGRLSSRKFDKFMTIFDNKLDIALNQSIQQILHGGYGKLEVRGVGKQEMSLETQSYLSNASVQNHVTQDRATLTFRSH